MNLRSAPTRRPSRGVPVILLSLVLLLVTAVTLRASNALFTATTTNDTNTFSTGSVALSDNDAGAALFTVSGLKPGSTGSACIRVTYSGTLPASVKLYGTGLTATNSLDQYITLVVDEGTNSTGSAGACGTWSGSTTVSTTTLTAFPTTYGGGAGTWAPSGAATKDYRFTYTMSAAAPNTVMNSTASVTFVWEAQNT